MARKKTKTGKTFNGDKFIMKGLRDLSCKWPARNECLKEANVSYGRYLCAGCKQIVPVTILHPAGKKNRKGKIMRIKNIQVDHILPVIDPRTGNSKLGSSGVDWEKYITRLFLPKSGFQALCLPCHKMKTKEENKIAHERRRREKDDKSKSD